MKQKTRSAWEMTYEEYESLMKRVDAGEDVYLGDKLLTQNNYILVEYEVGYWRLTFLPRGGYSF